MDQQNRVEQIQHNQYLVDFYGCYSTGANAGLAVIVLNRNLPEVTDRLCETIIGTTQIPFDLYVTESGSDYDKLSRYCSLHFVDHYSKNIGLRIGRGLNNSITIINKLRQKPYYIYWFLTNDVVLNGLGDYGYFASTVFNQYPQIGIIELPHLVNEYYTLNYLNGVAHKKRLNSPDVYPMAIQEKRFSVVPFGIMRSVFFNGAFVNTLNPIIDESNWRGWGCDEDLGYRGWQTGWWSVTAPYHDIFEDSCLTTRRSVETKTESVEKFKLNAEKDMKEFLSRKYNSNESIR